MYRGKACSRLLLSVPPPPPGTSWFSGCPQDGVVWWRGGHAPDPGVLRRLPVRGEPPADPLMPFARNSSPAACASSICYRHPSEEGYPLCPPVSPTPGGTLVLKQPLGTPPLVASAAAATLASTQRHPHAAGTRWHACHQPRHTRG